MFNQEKLLIFLSILLQFVIFVLGQGNFLTLGGPDYLGYSLNQVVESRGFIAKTYDVISKSGYIITATRVINPKANLSSITRTVVIHHGVTQSIISPQLSLCVYTKPQNPSTKSSDDQSNDDDDDDDQQQNNYNSLYSNFKDRLSKVENETLSLFNITGPEQQLDLTRSATRTCLAYYLSNKNYDVWLLEARGSTPASSRHVNKSITSKDYWNFDVHDQAVEDIPAQIDKVKEISGRNKVTYIGFSQSTAFMFILLSVRPQFAEENLVAYVAVAPVAFNHGTKGLFRIGWDLLTASPGFITNNLNQPFPLSYDEAQVVDGLISAICNIRLLAQTVCRAVVNFIVGPDDFNNVLSLPFFSRVLSQTSFKSYIQLGQWIKPLTFNQFDYKDADSNRQHYGQATPPEYNLTNIDFENIIFVRSRQNDYLSDRSDQEALIERLQKPLHTDIIVNPGYDHFSYWVGSSSFTQVIKPVVDALNKIYASQ